MNEEKYKSLFAELFGEADLEDYAYRKVEGWDSVGHLELCAAIEDTFNVMLTGEEVLGLKDYASGLEILKDQGIEF